MHIFNFQELCRRWEQYVLDHQAYIGSFDQCKSWVVSMRKKLQSQSDVKGDKRSVQERIEKLQVAVCFFSGFTESKELFKRLDPHWNFLPTTVNFR